MADDLTLASVPSSQSGWLSVVDDNFDEIEAFVNSLHTKAMVHDGDIVTHDGELCINFTLS